KVDVVQRFKKNTLRDQCCWFNVTAADLRLMLLDEDMEYIDIEEALNEGRQSTVSTARPDDDTARPDVSTAMSEEDERMTRGMNKKAKEESNDKGVDNTKKRQEGSKMKRMSKRHGAKGIYYRIFRSDGSSRWIKTFSKMVIRFDRLDLVKLYNLVIQRFESTTPKEDGTKIHMLAERRYPHTIRTLERMLSLRLIAESTSDAAYDLLRLFKSRLMNLKGMIEERRIFKCWF
nr:hypothetical protein [Tanacetum cinerariifolium]